MLKKGLIDKPIIFIKKYNSKYFYITFNNNNVDNIDFDSLDEIIDQNIYSRLKHKKEIKRDKLFYVIKNKLYNLIKDLNLKIDEEITFEIIIKKLMFTIICKLYYYYNCNPKIHIYRYEII